MKILKILKLIIKIFLTVLAWFGTGCIVFGIYIYSDQVVNSIRYPIAVYPNQIIERIAFGWIIMLGLILVLISGLIARPHYLWPVLVVIGVIFSIVEPIAIGYSPIISTEGFQWLGQYSIGIICIIEGLLIRWFRIKQNLKASAQS